MESERVIDWIERRTITEAVASKFKLMPNIIHINYLINRNIKIQHMIH